MSMLKYARSIKFEEAPNYEYIRRLLKDIAQHNSFEFDFCFDWLSNKAAQVKYAHVFEHCTTSPRYSPLHAQP